jgi:UDP-N-acetylglucosamine diphosphorylase / glucose-1-phosphate thymidylyltransferase / UDP-N-acetylgalactosamine diphosphorylase / glucosamine-1-phosphate N-acetyltransferase / galactosamine-1-phosphate N-acetyltransferase
LEWAAEIEGFERCSGSRTITDWSKKMKVSDLFSAEMEPPLNDWLSRFASPTDLFAGLHQLFANLSSQNIQGTIEDGASIIGPVHIGIGSIVRTQAIVRGPAIVGSETIVNSHAEIQPGCFLGSKCVIGHSCSIIESMLMNNAVVWPGAFVRNSIIGFGGVVGPGAVLGAVRLESSKRQAPISGELGVMLGDYSAVGANSTLKPGTVLGAGVVLGDGIVEEGLHLSG